MQDLTVFFAFVVLADVFIPGSGVCGAAGLLAMLAMQNHSSAVLCALVNPHDNACIDIMFLSSLSWIFP